jgi:peptidoglycan/xylan/chitin deacetylase (PgdA/CDA1 family)
MKPGQRSRAAAPALHQWKLAAALLIGALAALAHEDTTVPSRSMALTFDDLPYAGGAGPNAARATERLLAALKRHRAPAIGFVIESSLDGSAARVALLQAWLDAGMSLGNHTSSHADFNRVTVEQFEREILEGETVTRRLMKAKNLELRYFRHPMTHTGDTREKKEAVERFLAEHGYTVAPHTIENSDFMFMVPYSSALRRKNSAQIERLRSAYLDHTLAAAAFAETIAPRIFGRPIPQVLLAHANDINADCLDELLARLEARGYRFVTLDAAMADPAYRTRDDAVTTYGPTWLWRWTRSLGLNLSFKDDPEPPQWVKALYKDR